MSNWILEKGKIESINPSYKFKVHLEFMEITKNFREAVLLSYFYQFEDWKSNNYFEISRNSGLHFSVGTIQTYLDRLISNNLLERKYEYKHQGNIYLYRANKCEVCSALRSKELLTKVIELCKKEKQRKLKK